MGCLHCFVPTLSLKSLSDSKKRTFTTEIPFEVITRVISEATELGLRFCKFTGGEPFVRKNDVLRATEFCARKGILVSYDTNLTLINEDDVKFLRELGNVKRISVSLDYASADSFDKFRKYPGAFNTVINNIRLLRKYDIDVLIMASIYMDNLNEIPALTKIAKELGVQILFQPILGLGRAKIFLQDRLIVDRDSKLETIKFINAFIDKVVEAYNEYPGNVYAHLPMALLATRGVKYLALAHTKCPWKNMLAILWDGSVAPCAVGISKPETIIGNVMKESIKEIWSSRRGYLAIRDIKPQEFKGVCSKCIFAKYCGGFCIAYSYEKYGDYTMSNPICQTYFEMGQFPKEFLI